MNIDVFISYTTADRDCAVGIVEYLEGKGIDCFIAPRDIEPGVAYASCLMQALASCSLVVLIASEKMNSSEHVLNEVDVVFSRKIPLIPFFIEDFEMNDDYRYYLGRKQRIIAIDGAPEMFYDKLLEAVLQVLPEKAIKAPAPAPKTVQKEQECSVVSSRTVFEYLPERGIMINPEDHQRNISFRNDTLINLFGGFYSGMKAVSDEQNANDIFYSSGYSSGSNFAQRLNSQWDLSSAGRMSYIDKISKWCAFDSAVGWGMFTPDITIDEDNGQLSGTLTIDECFVVDKRDHRKICEFIRGYCNGVIETLLDNMEVELKCVSCPMKNKFKSACVFEVSLKEQ